jgi:hypothetical protein
MPLTKNNIKTISDGIFHQVPADMQKVLADEEELLFRWNRLTPIQRNEWICWVTIVKKKGNQS